ncbi:MAG: calcium/sodium antiporter [Bacteroidales bacterium]|nr:calcium/sodium antiporter [Bacteroidales bacterium]
MAYIFLIIGFVLLIKGADVFVEGSAAIATNFGVPSLIIGMTIVAMGTSAPETAVSLSAALKGQNAIAISNVIGSNFFNLFMVIGVCAIIRPMLIPKDVLTRDYPINLGSTLLVLVMCYLGMTLSHIDGIILLVLFTLFLIAMIKIAKKEQAKSKNSYENNELEIPETGMSTGTSIFCILIGITGIIIGGDKVVDSASEIAIQLGMSQHLVGLTIIAIGTSLPELVTSIVAGIKGENNMALGNVVGSNIFNLLLILGISSSIKSIPIDIVSIYDLLFLLGLSVIIFAYILKTKKIGRIGGLLFVIAYFYYLFYVINR